MEQLLKQQLSDSSEDNTPDQIIQHRQRPFMNDSASSAAGEQQARVKKADAKHAIHRNLKSTFGFLAVTSSRVNVSVKPTSVSAKSK